MAECSNLTESNPMNKLKQRRRAHAVNRCASGQRRSMVARERDICARFDAWTSVKRFSVSGLTACVGIDVTKDGMTFGDVSILSKEPLVLDATAEGLLVIRPQQECDLSAPFALVSRSPEQGWVRVSLDPR